MKKFGMIIASALACLAVHSCTIDPPLRLPAQDVLVDVPVVMTDMDIVWDIDVDWTTDWHYGWDLMDVETFGEIDYPTPTSFDIRRYFLGPNPGQPHTAAEAFNITGNTFRSTYEFGYYDMLIWSNIDSQDGSQVVVIDESDLNDVIATTSVTKGMSPKLYSKNVTTVATKAEEDPDLVTGLYNQPEIFYSAYPKDILISREFSDYDYYNEQEGVWVKVINTELNPIVYIYLVQVVLLNNEDGRVKGVTGNAAMSALANSTSVNTGHTAYDPCIVYFNTRFKEDMQYEGMDADIIGGKLTTYGLCDMEPYTKAPAQYKGSRDNLPNFLYLDVIYTNDTQETLKFDVTEQMQAQSHGGIVTVVVDCHDLTVPEDEKGSAGSLFIPTLEDYNEIVYEIPME